MPCYADLHAACSWGVCGIVQVDCVYCSPTARWSHYFGHSHHTQIREKSLTATLISPNSCLEIPKPQWQRMTDRSTRVYENEANWGSVLWEGGCSAAKKLHVDHGFTELANWECKRNAYFINQLWLSHLPGGITACGFAVRQVLRLLTVYSCYLGELVLLCCLNHHKRACVMPCPVPRRHVQENWIMFQSVLNFVSLICL